MTHWNNTDTSWIWTEWLQRQPARFVYQNFEHQEFLEMAANRDVIEDRLAHLIHDYHTYSPFNADLLSEMGYPQLAVTLRGDQRPNSFITRAAHLVEILACEFARSQGFHLPVLRFHYNPNPSQSMKGDDILSFRFAESEASQAAVLVGEAKFRTDFETTAIKEAYLGLSRSFKPYPSSMEFIANILSTSGDEDAAGSVRLLRRRLNNGDSLVKRHHLVFLGTCNRPRSPFEYLNDTNRSLENLAAVNIVFARKNFDAWLRGLYEEDIK